MAGEEGPLVDSKKKRKQREQGQQESSEQHGGAAVEEAGAKRKREAADEQTSTCHQAGTGPAPDRASVEPAGDGNPPKGAEQQEEGDSGRRRAEAVDLAAFDAAALGLDLTERALDAALDEEELPMAIDQATGMEEADAAEAAGPGATATQPAEDLSLSAPADAQATDLPPPSFVAAGVPVMPAAGGAAQAPPAPSKQESGMLPQCAMMTGTAMDAEVSTSQLEPLPPREPSQQYHTVKAGLRDSLIQPGDAGVNWDHFPNYLGEGVRARLLSLATLHLTAGAAPFPAAVKELPANSNRVLLGAANSCELYQERVVRALAQKVQAPLLVADVYSLKLDEIIKEDAAGGSAPGLMDDMFGGGGPGGFPPDPWEVSDEDDPFLGQPKQDKKEGGAGGRDSALDTALALRSKTSARRGMGMPGMAYFTLGVPGGRQPSGLAAATAAASAAAAAAERAAAAAKAAREKAEAAKERAAAAKAAAAAAGVAGGALDRAASVSQPASSKPGAAPLPANAGAAGAVAGEGQQQQQDAAAATSAAAPELAALFAAAVADLAGPQQPAASAAASGPLAGGTGAEATREVPSKPTAAAALKGAADLTLPAASAAPAGAHPLPPGSLAAVTAAMSRAGAPALRRGDRISYLGRVHPSLAVAQERLDQLQAAISRVELSGSQRARDYLPQLLMRRSLVTAQSQRVPRMQAGGAPPIGSRGRVINSTGDKVQVVFDEPFAGGATLPGQKEKCGFTCSAEELQAVEDKEDPLVSSLQALFDVVGELAQKGPIIVFIQNLDRLLRTHAIDHFRKLEALLAALPARCLLFAGYCSRSLARSDPKREGGPPGLSRFFGSMGGDGFGGGGGGADDIGLLDRFGRGPGRAGQRKSTKGKMLSKMLPNHLELHPPNHESHAKAWKKMVEGDVAAMRQRSNRTALRKALARCGMECDDWDAVSITDSQLARKEIEQIVGVAVAQQLTAEGTAGAGEGAAGEAAGAAAAAAAAGGEAEGAAAMERSGSAEADAEAVSTAAVPAEVVRQQEEQLPAGQEQQQQQQQQPSAMQTDEAEAAAPAEGTTAAAHPAATTAAAPGASDPTAGGQQPGAATAGAAGAADTQQPAAPLWKLHAEHLMAAAEALRKMQQEAAAQPDKQALKDVAVDQYEKQLLSEVIPPEEINVSFDDIGALETVKNTLHEVVILPLQRPELFMRGTLTKPTKGLLLFGPPGTGKTMLAKAVASESGAHFINVNMSAITSKWFGEGERLVRALFGLAHKLSPSVIFVDEIDSFLSKRGQSSNEHEALRKMKNEFMTHWDGLRTKQSDRVLVLAATNRPMDLDDAVIRRMPRRIFVPLPDAANRERILQVILKDEDLEPSFDFKEAAALADGYSGSDLKNLAIAAAYCPIREYLEGERKAAKKAKEESKANNQAGEGPGQAKSTGGAPGSSSAATAAAAAAAAAAVANSSATPAALAAVAAHVVPEPVRLRSINMADFKEALKQVTASSHSDSATSGELQRWNDQYGEGGSRRKEPLAYYT